MAAWQLLLLVIGLVQTVRHCAADCNDGCKKTVKGTEYRGNQAKTEGGLTCQKWDSQSPHQHTRNDVNQFPLAKYNEENYCRNPDNSAKPWCYTTSATVRWQWCDVPLCKDDCKTSAKGTEYRGTISQTEGGLTCQRWDMQIPNKHTRDDVSQFPLAKFNEENYCRNPDNSDRPWCYTTHPGVRWQYCNIPTC